MSKPLFIFVLFFCSFGCGKEISTEPKTFSLKMERTPCFGTCPFYSLNVESDGKVMFEGKANTNVTGKAEGQLSDEKIKALIAEINKAKFFSFEDDYGQNSKNCLLSKTDLPSAILKIKFDDKEKTIKHYHGCFVKQIFSQADGLKPLTDLEDKIDEIVGTKQWIGEN